MFDTFEPMRNLSFQQRNEAEQLFGRALQCAKANDPVSAARYYKQAVEYGHPGAQNNLGVLYLNGRGVNRDSQEAARLFEASAKQGSVYGMRNLASCYMNGTGVDANFDLAVEWLETAAEKKEPLACIELAKAYDNWSHRNEEKKIYWYKRAAELGNSDSMYFLGEYYKRPGEAQALSLAKDYLEKAAVSGNSNMKLKVAKAFDLPSNGDGPALSLERAAYWYNEVVNCDDDDLKFEAAKGLDQQFTYSDGLRRAALDPVKAYMTYRALGMRGNKDACSLAAYCCEIGSGTTPNIDVAIMLYERAGEKSKAEWCRKKKAGRLLDEAFESHKSYEVPKDSCGGASQGKEFYSEDRDSKEWYYNGRFYYIVSFYGEKSYVASSDQEGNDIRIEFEISDKYGDGYIYVNDSGLFLYFMYDSASLQIAHYDFDGCVVGEYEESHDDTANRVDHICIVDNTCLFVHAYYGSPDRSEIKRVYIDVGAAEVIYNKATSIERMFASSKAVIFNANYVNTATDQSADGWMMMDLKSRRVESLSNPYYSPETVLEHPEKYDRDSDSYDEATSYDKNILFFDLNHNIFWARRTALEGFDSGHLHNTYYLEPHPLEGDRDKIIENYPIWRFPSAYLSGQEYFDGRHHYYAENYYTFKSSDKYGNVEVWSTNNGGHGNCNSFKVVGDRLFLNIAAYHEEVYALTFKYSAPLRKSWLGKRLPREIIERYEQENDPDESEKEPESPSFSPFAGPVSWGQPFQQNFEEPEEFEDYDDEDVEEDHPPAETEDEEEDGPSEPARGADSGIPAKARDNSSSADKGPLTLSEFRKRAETFEGARASLAAYRKSLAERWDYNAFVGILMSVKSPKHGDAACMNMAIGQGDNFKSTETRLEQKGLLELYNKYKGKKYDHSVLLSAVEDEIVSIVPEYKDIRRFFDAAVIEPMSRGGADTAPAAPPIPSAAMKTGNAAETDLFTEKKIGDADIKYKICTLGSKFHIGFGVPVVIKVNGKEYPCKTHGSIKGRIDGMKRLYEENGISAGSILKASYSAKDRSIRIEIEG